MWRTRSTWSPAGWEDDQTGRSQQLPRAASGVVRGETLYSGRAPTLSNTESADGDLRLPGNSPSRAKKPRYKAVIELPPLPYDEFVALRELDRCQRRIGAQSWSIARVQSGISLTATIERSSPMNWDTTAQKS